MTTGGPGDPAQGQRELTAREREFEERMAGDLPPPPTGRDGKPLNPKQTKRLSFPNYPEALKEAQLEIQSRIGLPGMQFGWFTVDRALGSPIVSKELLVVAARAGVGKSWELQQFAETQLKADQDMLALFVSLEMSRYQVAERVTVHVFGGTPASTRAHLEQVDVESIQRAVKAEAPQLERLYIADIPLLLEEVADAVHLTEQRAGQKVKLLLIDYLGLVGSKNRDRRLYEHISEVVRQLKGIALELDMVILLAVQLSRGGGGAGDVEPDIASLRDSGAIEEAADRILLMWQTLPAEDDETPGEYVMVKLAKNRHGQRTGPVLLRFDQSMRLASEQDEYQAKNDIPF